ncbi:hypothetical protein [Cellulomonas sp. Root137]|uniref:hypothetical protein n=1 Tax=Cellulomonas sp. Root137 TaxID=1736459 RepID=UPI0009E74892|nr:hypothetical protein [Cellulomonas sp. Root137]
MPAPTPPTPPTPPAASTVVLRQALRDMLVLLGVLTVVGVGVGYLVDGMAGVWGALLGVGIALIFSGTTVVSVLKTVNSEPTMMMAVIMGAWLAKLIVVIIVMVILRQFDFYNPMVLFLVSVVGVIGSAVLDARAVQRGRVGYFES